MLRAFVTGGTICCLLYTSGLIYNEIGEVGAALTQWVISLNLQEQDVYKRQGQYHAGYPDPL